MVYTHIYAEETSYEDADKWLDWTQVTGRWARLQHSHQNLWRLYIWGERHMLAMVCTQTHQTPVKKQVTVKHPQVVGKQLRSTKIPRWESRPSVDCGSRKHLKQFRFKNANCKCVQCAVWNVGSSGHKCLAQGTQLKTSNNQHSHLHNSIRNILFWCEMCTPEEIQLLSTKQCTVSRTYGCLHAQK